MNESPPILSGHLLNIYKKHLCITVVLLSGTFLLLLIQAYLENELILLLWL